MKENPENRNLPVRKVSNNLTTILTEYKTRRETGNSANQFEEKNKENLQENLLQNNKSR